MNKKEEPGYGRWLTLGATTTWEHWDTGGSHNHPMFGGGLVWYYRKLAGMNADPENPGYRHIIFRPQPVDELSFAKYYNNTAYGEAGIHWKKGKNEFSMDVTVPIGSTATVYVPAGENQQILENGKDIVNSELLKSVGYKEGYHVFNISSGNYSFTAK